MLLAGDAGISPEEVERIKDGPGADGWSPFDAALVAAVDELLHDARVADATWATLAAELDTQQLMDVVFTVGAYDIAGHGHPHLRRRARRRPRCGNVLLLR